MGPNLRGLNLRFRARKWCEMGQNNRGLRSSALKSGDSSNYSWRRGPAQVLISPNIISLKALFFLALFSLLHKYTSTTSNSWLFFSPYREIMVAGDGGGGEGARWR